MTDGDLFEEINFEWDEVLEEQETVREIEPGNIAKAEAGTLTSGGLDRCIAIAAYDSESENGYLAHFLTQNNDDLFYQVQEFVAAVNEEANSQQDVGIHMAGINLGEFDTQKGLMSQEMEEVKEIRGSQAAIRKYLENLDYNNLDFDTAANHRSELQVDADNQLTRYITREDQEPEYIY